jgi:hypothetical protein
MIRIKAYRTQFGFDCIASADKSKADHAAVKRVRERQGTSRCFLMVVAGAKISTGSQLCDVCGLYTSSTEVDCERQDGRRYCSKICKECDETAKKPDTALDSEETVVSGEAKEKVVQWREWSLRTEPEEVPEEEEETSPSAQLETVDEGKEDPDAAESDTDAPVDNPFLRLQERLRWHPTQVLRYYRIPGTTVAPPLWVNAEGIPGADSVAPCQLCGGPRTCEFQVSI